MCKRRWMILAGSLLLILLFTLPVAGEHPVHQHDYPWPQDLGGRDIRINTRWRDTLAVTPFGPMGTYDWYDPDPRLQAWIEEVEEWFNVNIEFVEPIIDGHPSPTMSQFAERFITGEIDFEFASVTRDALLPLHAEGFLRPLDDVIIEDYIASIHKRWRFLYRPPLSAHKMFGVPYMFQARGHDIEEAGLFWNKELFEEAGLPSPYELWDNDEWTFDVLETLALELTRDTTGDGEIDQYGIGHFGSRWWNNLLVVNEAALTMEREGEMVSTLTEPEAIYMWEWMARMRNDLEVGVDQRGVNYGDVAMQLDWFFRIQHDEYSARAGETEYTLGFVPFPQGPDAPYFRVPTGNIWQGVLPVTEVNPRAVVEVVNALYRFKYPYIEPGLPREEQLDAWYEQVFMENMGWKYAVYDQRSLDYMIYMTPRLAHSDHIAAADAVGFWDAINAVDDGQSPASVMNEIEPAFQIYIDEMYEQ